MSPTQFTLVFFAGAAAMLALGAWLGRRVNVDADWRRLAAMGVACLVIGGGVAILAVSQENAAAAEGVPPANAIAGSAELLIAIALAWFGVLLGGVAWAQALQPPRPQAAPPAAEPTLREPPPQIPPGNS